MAKKKGKCHLIGAWVAVLLPSIDLEIGEVTYAKQQRACL